MRLLGFSAALLVVVISSFTNAQGPNRLYVEPSKHSGPIGKNYTFICRAQLTTGEPPILVWKKPTNEIIATEQGEFSIVLIQNELNSSTEIYLTILDAQEMDDGVYLCEHLEGNLGTFQGVLDVYQDLVPVIEGNGLLKPGEDNIITCSVDDSNVGTLEWKTGDKVLTNGRYDLNKNGKDDIEVKANNTLVILQGSQGAAGIYECINKYEDGRTNAANITVGNDIELEGPKSVKYTEEERARMECTATGLPKPTITWTKENGTIEGDKRFTVSIVKEKAEMITSQLLLIGVKMSDRGNYICTANNGLQNKTHVILLRVRDRLAALWPFLGIMIEVVILIAIIFVHEKCTQGVEMGDDDDDDECREPIKKDLDEKATSDGESDVRMRATKE